MGPALSREGRGKFKRGAEHKIANQSAPPRH
jgi:hypothetical protein